MTSLAFETAGVGDALPALALPPITRYQLALYCGGSGDHNPIHVDSDFARAAGMDDVFAHGMLSMAFIGRLVTGLVPHAAVRRFGVRFSALTHVGDKITVSGTIREKIETERLLVLDLQAVNQRGETTLTGQATVAC